MSIETAGYIEGARYVLVSIDQAIIGDGGGDALARPWQGRMFVHTDTAHHDVIISLWRCASEHARLGGGPVIWVGHDLTQLAWLHHCVVLADGTPCHGPTSWPLVVSRWNEPATAGSYICLLGGDAAEWDRFRERFGEVGNHSEPRQPPQYGRNLNYEILQALRTHGPMSKRAIARVIQARKDTVRHAVDQLARAGRVWRGHGWAWTCHPQPGIHSEKNP